MRKVSSSTLKKLIVYCAIVMIVGSLLSLLSTAFFANRVVNQLKELKVDQPLVRDQQIKNISTSLGLLNISVSNPFFAFTTLVATTPQTFLPTSRALRSADQFVSSASKFLQNQNGAELKMVDAVAHLDLSLPQLKKTLSALSQLHIGGLFSPLDNRLKEVRTEASSLLDTTTSIAPLLKIFPGISGQNSPRNYLIAFQNSAEARGTGGILGAYAVMNVDKGMVTFTDYGSNSRLALFEDIPIEMPSDFVKVYNDDPAYFPNSNISPHFPYGAKIWLSLWERQFGEGLDGVVTFDPIALSFLLQATGPVIANRQEVNSSNVVKVTLSDVYQKYKYDNEARKQFLVNIIDAVSKVIEENKIPLTVLMQNLIQPINEHRLLIYSDNPIEQAQIEKSSLSGSIEDKVSNEYRLIIQNTSGNKMDYYLERGFKVESLECTPRKKTKVTFTLKNTADPTKKLPPTVIGRLDLNRPNGLRNSHGVRAIVLAPQGSHVLKAVDLQTGKRFGFLVRERGRIGIGAQVDLDAGESESYSLTFSGGVGDLKNHSQPLVIPQKTEIIDDCKVS
jgi:hypothetical protein